MTLDFDVIGRILSEELAGFASYTARQYEDDITHAA